MRRFIRFATSVVAVVAIAILVIQWDSSGWWPIASALGRHNARVDVARGHYLVLTYGIADPTGSPHANLLRQRYGVEFHAVAGCIVSKSLVDYAAAYNEVSTAAVKGKFGRDVFREAYNEEEKNLNKSTSVGASN